MTAPLHAGCMALDGRGVLLIGRSGCGKSDVALRLVDRGWALVADDYVTLIADRGRLLASPPATIAGRMEVRGVGLVDLPFETGVPICLAILLGQQPDRMPEPGVWLHEGVSIPALPLLAFEPSAPLKIEHMLRLYGLALE